MKNYFYLLVLLLNYSCSEFVVDSQLEKEEVNEILNEDSIKTRGIYGDYWIEGGSSMTGKSTATFYLCAADNWSFNSSADIDIYVYGNVEVQGNRDGFINLNASNLVSNGYRYSFDIKALDDCGNITIEVLVNGWQELNYNINIKEPIPAEIPSANIKYCRTDSGYLLVEIPRTSPQSGQIKMEWQDEPIIVNAAAYTYTRTEEMGYNYLYYYIPQSEQISPGEPEFVPVYRYIFKPVDKSRPIDFFSVTFRTRPIYKCSSSKVYSYTINTHVQGLTDSAYGFVLPEGDATYDGDIIKW